MPYITYNDRVILYSLSRKRVKNINFRINTDGMLNVSAPKRVCIEDIEKAITEKAKWVIKWQDKIKSNPIKENTTKLENGMHIWFNGSQYDVIIENANVEEIKIDSDKFIFYLKNEHMQNQNVIHRLYFKWLKEQANSTFKAIINKYYNMLSDSTIPLPEIQIRNMKSRWGTCIPDKKKIVLNLSLIDTPLNCIEYVVLHELVHFKYNNHSKSFYRFIENIMPDWKTRKELLDMKYGFVI
jgi:predicted metal-dependent hydrolase